ncbi:hypothetical protein [Subtercola sp. YIM 133946]|uniref:hypothetical protein n=1 Tax=Subtercola sp. YIM 133946 TaxID=3118909 RepID=UPI002F9430D0
MQQGRVRKTPTGYGVIKVDARKQITVPIVDVPSLAQTTPARRGILNLGVATPRIAPAQ